VPSVSDVLNVTIADGESLSTMANCGLAVPVMLITPSGWDTAGVTFQVSVDRTNFVELSGVSITSAVASTAYALEAAAFAGAVAIKIRSGTASVPVNQSGAVTVQLACRKEYRG
jgi:hypothetical protein